MTKLYSHNMDVDRMNTSELAKLMPKSFTHRMRTQGAKPLVEQIMRGCLSPEELVLKVGAKVMFTKNNPEWGVVNGTTGTIDGTQHGSGFRGAFCALVARSPRSQWIGRLFLTVYPLRASCRCRCVWRGQ